jgi:Zn-dependent protease
VLGCGIRNWCRIFYSAEARRTRSQFIRDSRVTGNGSPSSLKRGRTVVNIDVLYVVSIWLMPVLIAVTFHEASHGYAARFLGDDTASRLGRVSLNPFRHIDPFGTILLPGLLLLARSPFLFGYAKPVPTNFRALRSPRIGMVLVAAAGPAMNIGLAIIAALSFHLVGYLPVIISQWTALNLKNPLVINVLLAIFNLFPLPPLDGGLVCFQKYWLLNLPGLSVTGC